MTLPDRVTSTHQHHSIHSRREPAVNRVLPVFFAVTFFMCHTSSAVMITWTVRWTKHAGTEPFAAAAPLNSRTTEYRHPVERRSSAAGCHRNVSATFSK
jgi:hypothetical protein